MEDTIRRASIMIALEEMRHYLAQTAEPSPSTRQPNRELGESGVEYIHRLLTENPMSCKEQLRLDRDQFTQLVDLMIARNLLEDGKYLKVSEQVGIALFILAKGSSYRDASDTFKHSVSTICKYSKLVLDALVILSFDIIRPHCDLSEIQPQVQRGTKY
ncbi:1 6-dihydroxycyclohexa-2 4-diene-1-carboxylate dehydrogenase [Bienertia sinuspersici]